MKMNREIHIVVRIKNQSISCLLNNLLVSDLVDLY